MRELGQLLEFGGNLGSALRAAVASLLSNLFTDEAGDYLVDEASNRLGE